MDQIPLGHSFFSTVIERRDSLDVKETFIDVCRTQSWRFAWDEIFPFFIMSQLCNQVYLAERKMGTLWSSKFEFFVPEKNTKQNVQRIKTRNFRRFYRYSYRWKQKKNYFIYTLRKRMSIEHLRLQRDWDFKDISYSWKDGNVPCQILKVNRKILNTILVWIGNQCNLIRSRVI